MFRRICLSLIVLAFLAPSPSFSQKMTPRGILRGEDLVSLSRETRFDQALEIIQEISGKVIIDPNEHKQQIGLDMANIPWERALELMVRANNLAYVRRANYFQITSKRLPEEEVSVPELDLETEEVNIVATFFEADRRALRELGINWRTLKDGKVSMSAIGVGGDNVGEHIVSLGGSGKYGTFKVDALFRALEYENKGKVISNPKVKVIAGKEGRIQVGQKYAVTTVDFAGNTIVQFFNTGTILTVTPNIVTEDETRFIHLVIAAERSTLVDPMTNTINVTEASTSVLLCDGEETVIAGLCSDEQRVLRKGVPLLKDLPWWFFGMRYLFGYDRKESSERELVIRIKVNIVPNVKERITEKKSS